MKLFIDTSALFKLYHQESDSGIIEKIFENHAISTVFLSEISKIEFTSSIWKKVRTKEITGQQARIVTELFEKDFTKYTFVQIDTVIIEQAKNLIKKYGSQGLRTLDGIQLSTSVFLKNQSDLFITSDNLLSSFFKQEELPTEI